jgi:hypothetical protein
VFFEKKQETNYSVARAKIFFQKDAEQAYLVEVEIFAKS